MTAKKKRNTLDDVDLKPLAVYTLFDSVLPTDTGVYAIVNVVSRKFYIGSARGDSKRPSGRGFRKRLYDHRRQLLKGDHHTEKLQRALNKTLKEGVQPNDVYQIWILEYVDRDLCIEKEQWYFDNYKPWYNGNLSAAGGVDGPRSPETKAKLSAAHKGKIVSAETRAKLSTINLGKKHTDETKLLMSKIHKGRVMTDEWKRRISEGQKGKIIPQHVKDILSEANIKYDYVALSPTGLVYEFRNLAGFIRDNELDLNASACGKVAKREQSHHKEWFFRYKDDIKESIHQEKKDAADKREQTKSRKGRILSEETRKKMSEARTGVRNGGKKFCFISPEGSLFSGRNVNYFAEKNNLSARQMDRLSRDEIDNYKGWTNYKVA